MKNVGRIRREQYQNNLIQGCLIYLVLTHVTYSGYPLYTIQPKDRSNDSTSMHLIRFFVPKQSINCKFIDKSHSFADNTLDYFNPGYSIHEIQISERKLYLEHPNAVALKNICLVSNGNNVG